jgi:hypothetical protein
MSSVVEQVKERLASSPGTGGMASADNQSPIPASAGEVDSVETELGFGLPPLLRTLYTEVARGGFGPGYGIIPVADLPATYRTCRSYAECKEWQWPSRLLPFCYWGCEVYECIDCSDPGGPVVHFDADLGGPGKDNFDITARSLERWVLDWLAGHRR